MKKATLLLVLTTITTIECGGSQSLTAQEQPTPSKAHLPNEAILHTAFQRYRATRWGLHFAPINLEEQAAAQQNSQEQ